MNKDEKPKYGEKATMPVKADKVEIIAPDGLSQEEFERAAAWNQNRHDTRLGAAFMIVVSAIALGLATPVVVALFRWAFSL